MRFIDEVTRDCLSDFFLPEASIMTIRFDAMNKFQILCHPQIS
jgi:hypothetical protein